MLTVETPERHRFDHPSDAIFDFEFQIHVTGKRHTKKSFEWVKSSSEMRLTMEYLH